MRALMVAAVSLGLALHLYVSCSQLYAGVTQHLRTTGQGMPVSDTYMIVAGVRMLLAGENPYSDQAVQAMHRELYGPTAAPPSDQNVASFVYPPFIAVPLLPLVSLPPSAIRWIGAAVMAACVALAVWLWSGLLHQQRRVQVAASIAALAFPATLELIWLQQPTGLVLLTLTASYWLASRGRFGLAGLFLGASLLKPQLAALPVVALLFWSVCKRGRWSLLRGFAAMLFAELAVSELLLPHWIVRFSEALQRYQLLQQRSYWLPETLTGSAVGGAIVSSVLVAFVAAVWWRCRTENIGSPRTLAALALTHTITLIILPEVSLYNRVFALLPLTSILAFHPTSVIQRTARRVAIVGLSVPVVLSALAGALSLVPALQRVAHSLSLVGPIGGALLPLLLLPAALVVAFRPDTQSRRA